jgi:hypothetical protein
MAQDKKLARNKSNNSTSVGYMQQRREIGAQVAKTALFCRLTTDRNAEQVVFTPFHFAKNFRTQL